MTVNFQPIQNSSALDFELTDQDFKTIAAFAKARFGLDLQPSKKPLVHSRLVKRLRALNLKSFADYCALLDRLEGADEKAHLLSALTTNVTHFFREVHHFDFLETQVAPQLIEHAKMGQPVRLWSAACSAGQEAYSMAAALSAVDSKISHYDIRILATDIDPQMIKKAKTANYPIDQLPAIPDRHKGRMTVSSSDPSQFQIKQNLRNLISFAELNLIEKWPIRGKFHAIFCRNAAIYFDKPTQVRLWSRFADALHVGGHLMIGHSERLSGDAMTRFKSAGITTYQKQQNADALTTK